MSTTVAELVAHLQRFPANAKVAMSSDAEGNEFSALDSLDIASVPLGWEGERIEEILFDEDLEDDDEIDEDELQRVVVLWPV